MHGIRKSNSGSQVMLQASQEREFETSEGTVFISTEAGYAGPDWKGQRIAQGYFDAWSVDGAQLVERLTA